MFCTNCGHEITSDARFCAQCGQGTGFETAPAGDRGYYAPRRLYRLTYDKQIGGVCAGIEGAAWPAAVAAETTTDEIRGLVSELAVEDLELPRKTPDEARYVGGVLAGVRMALVDRQITEIKSRLQRTNFETDPDTYNDLFGDLVPLEQYRIALREQAAGVAQ